MGDTDWYLVLIRLIHIVAGVLWVGGVIFVAGFLEPTVSEMGRDGGRVMQGLVQKRRLPVYFAVVAGLAILAGLLLYWRDSGHLEWEWVKTGPGIAYTTGGIAAIVVAVMGQAINRPVGERMGELGQQMQTASGPPDPAILAEMSALQARLRLATRVQAVLLIFVTVAMAAGRYLII
jgi:hypothetical protein